MSDHLLPCKKHNCLPTLRTIFLTSEEIVSIKNTRQEYQCHLCQQQFEGHRLQLLIDDWNFKQTAPPKEEE